MSLLKIIKQLGPGPLVAAAFIGPGTVTTCSLAGINHGYTLLWAITFSMITTIALQEMAARIALITGKDLGTNTLAHFKSKYSKHIIAFLLISAIVIGNSAYQTGNVTGAAVGLKLLLPESISNTSKIIFVVVVGVLAGIPIWITKSKFLEQLLLGCVIVLSLTYLYTVLIGNHDWARIGRAMFIPEAKGDALITVISLIGTTVVPYNLFLHSAIVKDKWHNASDLGMLRIDLLVGVILGGLVSYCIVITTSGLAGSGIQTLEEIATALTPSLGAGAKSLFGLGLFAAGLTSAITAPLAAAYVVKSIYKNRLSETGFSRIRLGILLLGVLMAITSLKPVLLIQYAQFANGVLLPFCGVLLLLLANNFSLLGAYKNKWWLNVLGFFIIIVCFVLGAKSLSLLFNLIN